ncbi:MAG: polysaccharide pyruvyl transferase family protein, partial [Gammaproteobacteria bacterium]|nr:polysaccharide pyruvyl transferase family protein [Gammaproteobacteria bacterium]
MAERLSGQRVIHQKDMLSLFRHPVHYWIGSHLAMACADLNAVVWGAGFISADVPITGRPAVLHAVRGWNSAQRLGDAALLLPRLYTPAPSPRRYPLGIIPHFREWGEPFFEAARGWDDVQMIDINGGIDEVVDQIASCDCILSSSLHGIICADSYGIPALWIRFSDKPVGDGFKFRDYFSSVGRPDREP